MKKGRERVMKREVGREEREMRRGRGGWETLTFKNPLTHQVK